MAQAKKASRKKPARKRGWNYPRKGYGPIRRWIPSWRVVCASILAFIGLCVGAFATVYAMMDVPEPGDFALAQTTTVYYSDGQTKMGTFADYERNTIPFDQMPESIRQAVVASEDQTFYTNAGISPRGIIRAIVNNVSGGARQGGSTLTQQYVERYYLGTTTGYVGKAKEAILALKINRQQSKDQILENYLNTIYFGRGAYGVETAAQKYFGISAKDMTLEQSALLVAVIPSPSRWDPAIDPDMAKKRWDRVIKRMTEDGYITAEQAAAVVFPQTIDPTSSNDYAGTNGYLLSAVVNELVQSGQFTEDDLSQNGLTIITTIDKDKQEASVKAVDDLPDDRPANNQVGLVSIDPRNGEIYAMYGGSDYLTRQRNSVTQDRAQAGSTFKPFALLAALEQGKSLNSRYSSETPKKFGEIEVENFDGINRGSVNLVTATKYSINTTYVALNEAIGPANTKAAAIQAGVPANTPGLDDTLTNVLGSASPRAIDMAKAYSTFAAKGVTATPHIVRSVKDKDGKEIYAGPTGGTRSVDADTVATINVALQAVTSSDGTGKTAAKLGRPVAGKTGTSSDTKSAWFIGYVPQMLTVVNMYQVGPNGEEEALTGFGRYGYGIGGGSFPAEIWLRYMDAATEGMEVEDFDEPVSAQRYRETKKPEVTEEATEPAEEATEEPTQESPAVDPAQGQPGETGASTPTPAPTTAQPTAPATQTPPANQGTGGAP